MLDPADGHVCIMSIGGQRGIYKRKGRVSRTRQVQCIFVNHSDSRCRGYQSVDCCLYVLSGLDLLRVFLAGTDWASKVQRSNGGCCFSVPDRSDTLGCTRTWYFICLYLLSILCSLWSVLRSLKMPPRQTWGGGHMKRDSGDTSVQDEATAVKQR
jgi:hypothetical protein